MVSSQIFRLGEDSFTLPLIRAIREGDLQFDLTPSTRERLQKRRDQLMERVRRGETIYGVNTGFGRLKDVRISPEALSQLQVNLVQSHAAGLGDPLPPRVVRIAMALRAHTLARGFSGVRPTVVDQFIRYLKNHVIPWVPEQGSVGASGDLAPLAHIAQTLIGEGYCIENGLRVSTKTILEKHHLKPLTLEAREGIALINGTQVSTAILIDTLLDAFHTLALSCAAYAMSLDALKGSIHATDPPVYRQRPYPGLEVVSEFTRKWLEDSEILASHQDCQRIQDAYSLRCAPQVQGSVLEGLRFVSEIATIEMNSVTDNPLILDDGEVLHNGNFHGAPVAMVADFLGSLMTTLSSIAERRIFRLTSPELSGLPPFLSPHAGVNSGYMLVHVTTAALVNENKTLAHPASIDSIPTSDNQEDHVSMSAWAARKARKIVDNTALVITAEILTAAQAIDFHRPLKTGRRLEKLRELIRDHIPFREHDVPFHEDMETLRTLLWSKETERLLRELQLDAQTLMDRLGLLSLPHHDHNE